MTSVVRPWLLICCVALAYGFAHFAWYAPTPLGRTPVLDERENIELADQIAAGKLPHEPFYRAMGYPLALAALRKAGVPARQLPLAALVLGLALEAACAVMIGAIARRWYGDARAGLVAGLLAAVYPVFVYFAVQRLDTTLSVALFLAGLLCLGLERDHPSWSGVTGASACWALAALTRPQFYTVWLLLPAVIVAWRRARRGWGMAAGAVVLGGLLFCAQGFWQQQLSGTFRILPWQGAYNLWAANRPGANGRYFLQTVDTAYSGPAENPALRESEIRYRRDTGRNPTDIDAMNAFWRARFLDRIWHQPASWLELLAGKTYALLNNWEQYNNKTYAFQKSLSPWLRWNPLGWGVLLLLAIAGFWRLRRGKPRTAGAAAAIAAVYAAGVVLFYASARFRLPLAALLCVWAGGALARPGFWRAYSGAGRWALAAGIVAAGLVAFSSCDGVRDARPVVQDHLLMARASQAVGDDLEAWRQARAALALNPGRPEAEEFIVTSGFNRLLAGPLPASAVEVWRNNARRFLDAGVGGAGSRVIAATLLRDTTVLRAAAGRAGTDGWNALGALVLLHAATPTETMRLRDAPWTSGTALFLMARQDLDPAVFAAWAKDSHRPPGWTRTLHDARLRLFAPPAGDPPS